MPEQPRPGEGMTGSRATRPAPTHIQHRTGDLYPQQNSHIVPSAATSLRRAGPRSRPFVLATLRALRLDRRPSPSAAYTEAENDENTSANSPLTQPRPFRDDNISSPSLTKNNVVALLRPYTPNGSGGIEIRGDCRDVTDHRGNPDTFNSPIPAETLS